MAVDPEPSIGGVDFSRRNRGELSVRAEALTWHHALFAVASRNASVRR
jgi:hypothetical protein